MTSRSMPTPSPPVGGIPYSKCPQVVLVDRPGLQVARRPRPLLLLEPHPLLDRVVELAVAVGDLAGVDEQLEALREQRVRADRPGPAARSRPDVR